MRRADYIPITALAVLLLIVGCFKTDEVDNKMKQSFSIPLGEKPLKIDAPTIIDNNSKFFYNGKPYRIVTTNFRKEEMLNFEMDSITKNDIIRGVDFKIRIKNSYPANAFLQVYLLNSTKQVIDSFFVDGLQKISAGEVDILAEPDLISTTILDASFHDEKLTNLRNTKYLNYVFYLETKRQDGAPLKFTSKSDMKINLAIRLYLQYNINEL